MNNTNNRNGISHSDITDLDEEIQELIDILDGNRDLGIDYLDDSEADEVREQLKALRANRNAMNVAFWAPESASWA